MAELELQRSVKAKPEEVWAVIADVAGFAEAAPGLRRVEMLDSEDGTPRRRCENDRNAAWTERCVDWQDGEQYTMESESVDDGLPFSHMRATYAVVPRSHDVLVTLRYVYRPRFWLFGGIADALFIRKSLERFAHGLMDNWIERVRDRQRSYKATVATILRRKGNNVITVVPDDTIATVAATLKEHRIGVVIVAAAANKVEGLVSERDVVRAVATHGPEALERPVSEFMTRRLFVCSPDQDMFFAMACMTDRRIRHLPVMENDTLVGIISIGDVVKERIHALESESEAMREYIAGREWRHHHHAAGMHESADLLGDVGHM